MIVLVKMLHLVQSAETPKTCCYKQSALTNRIGIGCNITGLIDSRDSAMYINDQTVLPGAGAQP